MDSSFSVSVFVLVPLTLTPHDGLCLSNSASKSLATTKSLTDCSRQQLRPGSTACLRTALQRKLHIGYRHPLVLALPALFLAILLAAGISAVVSQADREAESTIADQLNEDTLALQRMQVCVRMRRISVWRMPNAGPAV